MGRGARMQKSAAEYRGTTMSQARYLFGRVVDPLFGVAVGVMAYRMHERRMELPRERTLAGLVAAAVRPGGAASE